MTLAYHDTQDLVDVRPDIMNYGVEDFTTQMEESESIINRILDARWYRNIALNYSIDWRDAPFDSALLLNGDIQLRRLAVYKSLELIYLYLMKEAKDIDPFEKSSKLFQQLYKDELNEVLQAGLDYDWDESGSLASTETLQPNIRRLYRV